MGGMGRGGPANGGCCCCCEAMLEAKLRVEGIAGGRKCCQFNKLYHCCYASNRHLSHT